MNSLQEQVGILTSKVDALQEVIFQVNSRVSEILNVEKTTPALESPSNRDISSLGRGPSQQKGLMDPAFSHKDILLDDSHADLERQNNEANLSPDIQIQRLTAQLTAAYNRIAALEEQLLAARASMH